MNHLLLLPEECISPNEAVLSNARARHAIEQHQLSAGDSTRVIVPDGRSGKAKVIQQNDTSVRLRLELEKSLLEPLPIDLVVAVPRPQAVKRLIYQVASLGLQSLHFVRSSNSDKSYLQSKQLDPENIQQHLIKGLEQSGGTHFPKVVIHSTFKPFIENIAPNLSGPARLIASPQASGGLCSQNTAIASATLAIGPELGWSEFELDCFTEASFQAMSLGPRVLSVDVAAVFLIGHVLTNIRHVGTLER